MSEKEKLEKLIQKLTSVMKKREEMLEEAEGIIRTWLGNLEREKAILKEIGQKRKLTRTEMLGWGNIIREMNLLEKLLRAKREGIEEDE